MIWNLLFKEWLQVFQRHMAERIVPIYDLFKIFENFKSLQHGSELFIVDPAIIEDDPVNT